MTATYWVQVTDELLQDMDPSLLPDGLRIAGPAVLPGNLPGTRWVQFTDDSAPPGLDGRRVELTLSWLDDQVVISERRLLT